MTAANAAPVLTIGDRPFTVVELERITLEQDNWITAVLERAGLTDPRLAEITADLERADLTDSQLAELDRQARAREMRLRVLESGRVGALLAGFLVQEGSEWSADRARENARLLSAATALEDRVLLQALISGVIDGFFGIAASSDNATRMPSSPGDRAEAAADTHPDSMTSEGGSRWSEASGVTNPPASPADSAGPSETLSAPMSSS